ncbi:hypothetical protein [Commensalibacter nepenthis]|uniref:Uncharacterized protein n=1 Tax=Commensalibacter nepenthis TaxID=3043872 RepID=A0ABT6Q5M5_9PROT|nr:hypothetical protein [Commensalibacter sp. TBRC 10068]MDI2112182.1 hypothetical protein [Commensalibacter sp. TBRC 10068]
MQKISYILFCILFPSTALAQNHIPKTNDAILTATERFILPILCQNNINNVTLTIENCYKNISIHNPSREKCVIADYALYDLAHYLKERADIIGDPNLIHTSFFEEKAINQRLSDFQKTSPPFQSYTPQEFKHYITVSASVIKDRYLNKYDQTGKNCSTDYQP